MLESIQRIAESLVKALRLNNKYHDNTYEHNVNTCHIKAYDRVLTSIGCDVEYHTVDGKYSSITIDDTLFLI